MLFTDQETEETFWHVINDYTSRHWHNVW